MKGCTSSEKKAANEKQKRRQAQGGSSAKRSRMMGIADLLRGNMDKRIPIALVMSQMSAWRAHLVFL